MRLGDQGGIMNSMSLKDEIAALASADGADLVTAAPAGTYAGYIGEVSARLRETGASGKDYMLPSEPMAFFGDLSDVRRLLPSAKSVVFIGAYAFDENCDYGKTGNNLQGKTARTYAYYPVVRQIAEKVTEFIMKAGYRAIQGQQIPLKYAAGRIGLGSYGQNGLLFTRQFGSFAALRAVITEAELEPDTLEPPQLPCENCGRCLKACPTGALYAPYKVNPALCINPLTRREDDIPQELRRKMGNWVCGCDICQDACPVNQQLKPRKPDPRAGFDPVNHSSHRTLGGLEKCPDLAEMLRNGRVPVMQRNAIIALANIGTKEAKDTLQQNRGACSEALDDYLRWAFERFNDIPGRHKSANASEADMPRR
ncbi:MAG: epoxyqueuosine reductase [Spirochaetales bacterium]|nr:MAG: epoxyqueuosine reductase [Spirochaetales bacterium]